MSPCLAAIDYPSRFYLPVAPEFLDKVTRGSRKAVLPLHATHADCLVLSTLNIKWLSL